MKRIVLFLTAVAFLAVTFEFTATAWGHYRHHYYRHHPPPAVKPVPPPPGPKPVPPPPGTYRPAGWCKDHPQKCNPIVDTKHEACWDGNRDGFIDDLERTEMKKHPGECPK